MQNAKCKMQNCGRGLVRANLDFSYRRENAQ